MYTMEDHFNLTVFLNSFNFSDHNSTFSERIDTNSTLPVIIGQVESILIQVVWGVIIALGSVGNSLVIYTMGRHGDRSATSYYIIDLALADLAFITISFPLTTSMFASQDWLFGGFMCKLANYIILVTLHATCITLTAMTIDRYFAIVYPIRSIRTRTPKTSLFISIGIWIASFTICIPFLIFYREVHFPGSRVYCYAVWPNESLASMVSILVVLTTYFVPLIIIVVCYTLILKHLWNNRLINRREDNIPMNSAQTTSMSNPQERRRKKVTKMVAIVVILFATFWFPIHAYNLCFTLLDNFPLTKTSIDIKVFALTLSYASSFVNPFVYAFMGDGFRRAFRRSFPQVTRGGRIAPGIQSEGGNSASMETRLIESRNPSTRLKAQLVVKVEDVDEEENEDVAETAT